MVVVIGQARRSSRNYGRVGGLDPFGGAGWTEEPPVQANALEVFVAKFPAGNDITGNGTENAPYATPGKAMSVTVGGRGDRIRFRRGDTFTDVPGQWDKSGASVFDPFIIGAYGDVSLARPIFDCASTFLSINRNNGAAAVDDLWVKDLEIKASASYLGLAGQNRRGVDHISGTNRLLIEGCYIHGFTENIVFAPGGTTRIVDPWIRRSVIADAWGINYPNGPGNYAGISKGFYGWKCDRLLIEDCVFDHNGWNETVVGAEAHEFNHNLYMGEPEAGQSFNTVIRRSMFSAGSMYGTMCRSGATLSGNVYARNAVGYIVGRNENTVQVYGAANRNVVLDGRDVVNLLGQHDALGWGANASHVSGGSFLQNVVGLCGSDGTFQVAVQFKDLRTSDVRGNIIKGWLQNGVPISDIGAGTNTPVNSPTWDALNSPDNDWDGSVTYLDPLRNVMKYGADVLGLVAPTHTDVMALMRTLRKGAWVEAYTPRAMNTWILQGFYL